MWIDMMKFDQPDTRRQVGLDRQQAEHAEELAGVEAEIEHVRQLQVMADNLRMFQGTLVTFEESEMVMEQVGSALVAVHDLEAKQDFPALLARRRQLKQLIETGKIDLDTASIVSE